MAHALTIDTLAFSKKLREAGADERLADAIVEGITAADTSELVTKSDLRETEVALRAEIASVKTDLRAEIADVRATQKLHNWMLGANIGLVILVLGKLLITH
jgi:membrane-bound ClpP family serine protease